MFPTFPQRVSKSPAINAATSTAPLSRRETTLLLAVLALVCAALFGPALTQSGSYQGFADQRAWLGITHAADVLSNLAFALGGLWGFWQLSKTEERAAVSIRDQARSMCAAVFFSGLLATAVGSSWFHLQPSDAGLVVDRLTMVFAFAGVLGLAACERVSLRLGLGLLVITILGGMFSLWYWTLSNNIMPWGLVQFGGMALLFGMSFARPQAAKPEQASSVSLIWVLAIYAIAKLFEHFDQHVFELSAHLISGHTLKHLVASLVAIPVIRALHDHRLKQAF
jgi:hypothetical protein